MTSLAEEIVDEWWKYAKPDYNYCFRPEKEKLEELISGGLASAERTRYLNGGRDESEGEMTYSRIVDLQTQLSQEREQHNKLLSTNVDLEWRLATAERQRDELLAALQVLLEDVESNWLSCYWRPSVKQANAILNKYAEDSEER